MFERFSKSLRVSVSEMEKMCECLYETYTARENVCEREGGERKIV